MRIVKYRIMLLNQLKYCIKINKSLPSIPMDDELQAIRAARLAQLQNGAAQQNTQQRPADLAPVLARLLEPSARERLSRVRIVRPERADQVEQYIMRLHQMGGLTQKLSEKDVVQILDGISRDKTGPKIVYNRKLNADLDLDDED